MRRQHRAGVSLGDVLLPGQAAGGALPAQQAPQEEGGGGYHDQSPHAGVCLLGLHWLSALAAVTVAGFMDMRLFAHAALCKYSSFQYC